jgi:soluble lytic murein transglycosylase-like protein
MPPILPAYNSSKSAQTDLESIFRAAAAKYGVPLNLLKAVAKVESSFRPNATSRCGAMGIMQLMPRTAKWLGVTDAYDPEQNIMGGAKYLGKLLHQYDGDVRLTLAAYNAGPGTVRKYGGVPPFAEGYVNKVLKNCGGEIPASSVSTATNIVSVPENALSAAGDAGWEDSLASILLQNTINQIRLMENLNVEQNERNTLFKSQA